MKTFVLLCALVVVVVSRPEETYDPLYDNFNANEVAANTRLLQNYAKCFLEQGPCTSEGTSFKKVIPEAVQTNCVKCSPKQKELIRIVVKALQEKLPELWEQLAHKQDPDGKYKEDFRKFINATD